jgi:hypothetical protein
MQTTLACNVDWLDSTAPILAGTLTTANTVTTTPSMTNNYTASWYYGGYWYPYYPLTQLSWTADPRPIKLKMSEVERLRKAAKDDPKLKAILNKFTAQIEIVVDFD